MGYDDKAGKPLRLLGLDIGGSKTDAVLWAGDSVLARSRSGSANVQGVSPDTAQRNLAEVCAAMGPGPIDRVVAGSGGVDQPGGRGGTGRRLGPPARRRGQRLLAGPRGGAAYAAHPRPGPGPGRAGPTGACCQPRRITGRTDSPVPRESGPASLGRAVAAGLRGARRRGPGRRIDCLRRGGARVLDGFRRHRGTGSGPGCVPGRAEGTSHPENDETAGGVPGADCPGYTTRRSCPRRG